MTEKSLNEQEDRYSVHWTDFIGSFKIQKFENYEKKGKYSVF